MELVNNLLDSLNIGPARTFAALTVFPLIGRPVEDPRRYATLDEGLAEGTLRITERGEEGSVPELLVANDGARPVLLLDGEELAGAKQNRVLNLTILAPAGKEIVVPVSCVEQGRWARTSPRFSSRPHVMYSMGRAAKMVGVTASARSTGRYGSDQLGVWDSVAAKMRALGVNSPSQRMDDIYTARGREMDEYVEAFPVVDGQVGAVFALAGRLEGMEVFDQARTLERLLPKLVRSWALDAVSLGDRPHDVPGAEDVRKWLGTVGGADATEHTAVGLGRDLRLSGGGIAGSALTHDETVVHLCAFRSEEAGRGTGHGRSGRIVPASRRSSRDRAS